MGKKSAWLVLSCLIVVTLLLASCTKSTTSNPTTTTTTTTTTQTTTTTTTTTSAPATTTTSAPATTPTTQTSGHWWDSLGTPQYGGTLSLRLNRDLTTWDPWSSLGDNTIMCAWMERLFTDDWTMDPSVFNYQIAFRPNEDCAGYLAQSWEFTSQSTLTVKLRQNVYYQNIPPVSGRQFTSADVVAHFNRMYGLAGVQGSPKTFNPIFKNLQAVTAPDKYTVVIQFAPGSNAETIMEMLEAQSGTDPSIECPEVVAAGKINDWHYAMGTGPFILESYVAGSAATLVRNPNYWGTDERYPGNKLPYIDELKYLIIPDDSTAISAVRTGKLSIMDGVSLQNANATKNAYPNIQLVTAPISTGLSIEMRDDTAPFSDLRVRQALQMAIDLPTIDKTLYNNTCPPNPSSLTSQYMTGWGDPYSQWPQDLQAQYAYNPTAAKKLLSDAGYPTIHTQIAVQAGTDLDLLQAVTSYWTAIGVTVDINQMDSASWTALVRANRKYDGMAIRAGTGILGMGFEPVSHLIWYTWGPADYAMVNDPTFNAFSTAMTAATTTAQVKQIIHDANLYAAQQHFSISLLQPNNFSLVQPNVRGYNAQYLGAVNAPGGPLLNGFYDARFWLAK
jgi:peptide/nickel transport system substrate-binding protein